MTSKSSKDRKFLDALRRSRLLTRQRIDAVLAEHHLKDAESIDVARKMVKEKLLTPFQAQRLLHGKWRGLVIEEYRVLEPLGRGGMGWVYIAENMTNSRRAAVKVMHSKTRRDEDLLDRFRREAAVGMKLDHPNVLKTLATGTIDDRHDGKVHYIVMDFFVSVNLHELLSIQDSIPWSQACDFICQAARGLHCAHEAGIVHRDVKPDNLLLLENGSVKLLDFGLALVTAKANLPAVQQSDEARNLGTADYVSPEQIHNAMSVDGRADIYSLGCTFYFALTGRQPFPVESKREKVECQLERQPAPLSKMNSSVPKDVVAVVNRMMSKSPDDRFPTAEAVADALEPLTERKPVEFDFPKVLRARAKNAREKPVAATDSKTAAQDSVARAVASSIRLENSVEIISPEVLQQKLLELTNRCTALEEQYANAQHENKRLRREMEKKLQETRVRQQSLASDVQRLSAELAIVKTKLAGRQETTDSLSLPVGEQESQMDHESSAN